MSKDKNLIAIILAILAAALYAISTPVSKMMLQTVAPTMVAAFLYLGAGIGMGAMMLVRSGRHRTTEERLHRSDIPYTLAMIVLDIAAPILMMYGLKTCSASNTSLLNNFEIVATALIALLFFGESVKRKLWIAIMLVTVASILLSLEDGHMSEALTFSRGSLLVLGATFHAPQEVTRLLSHSVDYAQQARLLIARVAAKHGHNDAIPVPDYSTKAKAQAAIGLDMQKLNENKQRFLQEIEPKWIEEAKKNGKLIEI